MTGRNESVRICKAAASYRSALRTSTLANSQTHSPTLMTRSMGMPKSASPGGHHGGASRGGPLGRSGQSMKRDGTAVSDPDTRRYQIQT